MVKHDMKNDASTIIHDASTRKKGASTIINKASINIYKLDGYSNVIAKSRSHTTGGGVMIQLRDDVSFIKELETPFNEGLCFEVSHHQKTAMILLISNEPKFNKLSFIELLDEYLEHLSSKKVPIVVTGDFNIDVIAESSLKQLYLNAIKSNGFDFLSSDCTRQGEDSETCLDHFFTKNYAYESVETLCEPITDHFPIILHSAQCKPKLIQTTSNNLKFMKSDAVASMFNAEILQNVESVNASMNVDQLFFERTSLCRQ